MFTKEQIINKLEAYINSKIDEMSIGNSLVMVFRPVIHRATKKVMCKIDKMLDFVADENGMIDVVFNGITVGNGKFAIDIPFIDKELVFTKEDIEDLKAYLLR